MERPIRTYKNIEDARRQLMKYLDDKFDNIIYPCFVCFGYGRIIDQFDENTGCLYPNRIMCPKCEGKRSCTKVEFRAWYHTWVKEYNEKLAEYKRYVKIYKTAWYKLTKEEREVLGLTKLN